MTVLVEGSRGFYFGARATLLDQPTDREVAWAENHIIQNPAHSYLLGKFVEADRANNNKQFFSMDGLRMAQPTIAHSPMNIDHNPRRVVGAFVATDFVHPVNDEGASTSNPYIEALGVIWKAHFPEEYAAIRAAHDAGHLFYSMECVPKSLTCEGPAGCGQTYEYAGRQSPTYCSHLNDGVSIKHLNEPHFTAGAVLLPPVKPGWSDAEIHTLVAREAQVAEDLYNGVKNEMPDLTSQDWEAFMMKIMETASESSRNIGMPQRKKMAKSGQAMDDGSFPIATVEDLKNAIKLAGQSKNPDAARAHIKARAAALKVSDLIPATWK